jgi:ubiquinone biosynthesis protein UbiJ
MLDRGMTEHPRSDELHESTSIGPITVQLPREEVEALLLAVDALQPLLDRLRAQIAPVPVTSPTTASPPALRTDDALQRVTRLARQSLHEARLIVGERRITPEQRTAWQEAARRYWQTARHAVMHDTERDRTR